MMLRRSLMMKWLVNVVVSSSKRLKNPYEEAEMKSIMMKSMN